MTETKIMALIKLIEEKEISVSDIKNEDYRKEIEKRLINE